MTNAIEVEPSCDRSQISFVFVVAEMRSDRARGSLYQASYDKGTCSLPCFVPVRCIPILTTGIIPDLLTFLGDDVDEGFQGVRKLAQKKE